MRDDIIYISGAYTAPTREERVKNIQMARETATKVWEAGYTAICPHLNTANFEDDCQCTYQDYLDGDLEIIRRLDPKKDGLLMLSNWHHSNGSIIERDEATKLGLRIYYGIEDLLSQDKRQLSLFES